MDKSFTKRDPADLNGLTKEEVKKVKMWDITHRIEERNKRVQMIIHKKASRNNKKDGARRVKEEAAKADKKIEQLQNHLPEIARYRPESKDHDNVNSIVRTEDALDVVKTAVHEVHTSTIAGNLSDAEDGVAEPKSLQCGHELSRHPVGK